MSYLQKCNKVQEQKDEGRREYEPVYHKALDVVDLTGLVLLGRNLLQEDVEVVDYGR